MSPSQGTNCFTQLIRIMEKIWLFTQESNIDGEIYFNVVPCKDEATAKKLLE
jgi:hypothetical protein